MNFNQLKISLRRLLRDRYYTAINILGLAIGISCFLFILVYVKDELSFDAYHEKADQIYRIQFSGKLGESEIRIGEAGDITGATFKEQFPEVIDYTRFRAQGDYLVSYEGNTYREPDVIYADSNMLDVFSFNLLAGNKKEVLNGPNKVLITESRAEKYFGSVEQAPGKVLLFDGDRRYTVSGVIENIPRNSHFRKDFFLSMAGLEESRRNVWTSMNFYTYLVLQKGVDPAGITEKLPEIIRTYVGGELEKFMGKSFDDILAAGNSVAFSLIPLKDIHLQSNNFDELGPTGDIKYIYLFSFIGFFILLIGCINFMNLATARSARRAKEVGIRKVVGAQKKQLIWQFLGESSLITFCSLLISLVIIQLLLPQFNLLAGKNLSSADLQSPWVWGAGFLILISVGLLSGSYPAFFLSAFRPIRVLKGKLVSGKGGKSLRNGLVVFQFIITSLLIVGTLIISDQMNYIQNKKLGFSKEQVLLVQNAYGLESNLQAFKSSMKDDPQISNATITSFLPIPSARNTSAYFEGNNVDPEGSQILQHWYVDEDYVETLGLEIIDGRNFNRARGTDSMAVIINRATALAFGWEEPLNKMLSRFTPNIDENGVAETATYHVVGVVEDFHFQSLRNQIAPMVLHFGQSSSYVALKTSTTDLPALVGRIESQWKAMAPDMPFEYSFLDEGFDEMYKAEVRVGSIMGTFAFLAILIACIGLLGLTTFTAEQRTKEIAVRKVLGASMGQLFVMLTSEFTKWVLLANLIALPISYLIMSRWLEGFAYQTSIGIGTLLLAFVAGLVIAAITVCFQSIKASRANPVVSLKYE